MQTYTNGLLEGGKYEVVLAIQDKQVAKEYLDACIQDAIQAGIHPTEAKRIELENILNYAKRFNQERRVQALFAEWINR